VSPEQIGALLSLGSVLKDLGAIGGLLVLLWLVLDGRLITKGHHAEVVAAEKAATVRVEAWGTEWKRLATRGSDEIIVPLATAVRQLGAAHQQEPQ